MQTKTCIFLQARRAFRDIGSRSRSDWDKQYPRPLAAGGIACYYVAVASLVGGTSCVGSSVGGASVGSCVGASVGACVGVSVGTSVGCSVGAVVGDSVGAAVGSWVGTGVEGAAVGLAGAVRVGVITAGVGSSGVRASSET